MSWVPFLPEIQTQLYTFSSHLWGKCTNIPKWYYFISVCAINNKHIKKRYAIISLGLHTTTLHTLWTPNWPISAWIVLYPTSGILSLRLNVPVFKEIYSLFYTSQTQAIKVVSTSRNFTLRSQNNHQESLFSYLKLPVSENPQYFAMMSGLIAVVRSEVVTVV